MVGRVFRAATTYMGTIVGAGFASGQETLKFFTAFGSNGLWGLLLATAGFCFYGVLVMDLGRRLKARSHREVLEWACGTRLGGALDLVTTCFLAAILVVMIAGGAAVAAEQLGVPRFAGALVTAALTVATVLTGMRGIMAANCVVVPLLVLAVVALSAAAIASGHLQGWRMAEQPWPALAAAPHWALAACLYVGYNLVLAISILAPLGAELEDRRAIILGGAIGGLGLGALAAVIRLALGYHMPDAAVWEVPMLFLARLQPAAVAFFYTLILWAEIYTTAIASAYGFARRIAETFRVPYPTVVLLSAAGALAFSRVGFARLVETLYPFFGYVTVGLLAVLGLRALSGRAPG
jgi:uncharacterized membrane protein YkvI